MAQINIDTPFKHCNECEYLVIECNDLYANSRKYERYFYCKYAHICRNAAMMAEKEKEK